MTLATESRGFYGCLAYQVGRRIYGDGGKSAESNKARPCFVITALGGLFSSSSGKQASKQASEISYTWYKNPTERDSREGFLYMLANPFFPYHSIFIHH